MTTPPALGVCYFPEHWPQEMWARDATRMVETGLKHVRIGEFAWAVIEPAREQFAWDWLDRALDVLGEAGLEVMLCTPTATPPKWLVNERPDILAWSKGGRPRRFGSRRHYCFSSRAYRQETQRITTALAERYGQHPVVTGWQTDNEYGCHDTVRSYSPEATLAFRTWLIARYGDVAALNAAWGNVFWSMTYASFDEVDLPNLTVTEPNPSHVLDFYRFSSDQVASYNQLQVDILRAHSPGREIAHNFMGQFFDFDHFRVAESLDIASWDSYPLGFLDVGHHAGETKAAYLRQGHPDFQGFHHDLYRAVGRGRLQIMEQQPGPVNWARHNPAPLDGMVATWTHEAMAHGADVVRYFRWRQAPFAQEQMHAGLERPDGEAAPASDEAAQVARDITAAGVDVTPGARRVALVFDYEAQWLFEAQPQGAGWHYFALCLDWYGAARALALDVEIVPKSADFSAFDLILAPSLPFDEADTVARMASSGARVLLGPRSFSKTESLTIPDRLAPGSLQDHLAITVTRSESLPPFAPVDGTWRGRPVRGGVWLDHIGTELEPLAETGTGQGLLYRTGGLHYLTTVPDAAFLALLVEDLANEAGLETCALPAGLRITRTASHGYAFNYSAAPVDIPVAVAPADTVFSVGGRTLAAAGTAIWAL